MIIVALDINLELPSIILVLYKMNRSCKPFTSSKVYIVLFGCACKDSDEDVFNKLEISEDSFVCALATSKLLKMKVPGIKIIMKMDKFVNVFL